MPTTSQLLGLTPSQKAAAIFTAAGEAGVSMRHSQLKFRPCLVLLSLAARFRAESTLARTPLRSWAAFVFGRRNPSKSYQKEAKEQASRPDSSTVASSLESWRKDSSASLLTRYSDLAPFGCRLMYTDLGQPPF